MEKKEGERKGKKEKVAMKCSNGSPMKVVIEYFSIYHCGESPYIPSILHRKDFIIFAIVLKV